MVPVGSSVMLELVLAVHSYHVIAYPVIHGQEVLKFILGCFHVNFFLFRVSSNGLPTEEKSLENGVCLICMFPRWLPN